ncbi:MAG: S9 family peptidase [Hyphomicrobiaceae bacterium]
MTIKKKPSDTAPVAARKPISRQVHGIDIVDDYGWLKADNWQEVMRDPSRLPAPIRAQLEAENAHTAAWLDDTEALQARLFAEMKGRIREDDSSVPAPDGHFAYYVGYVTGGQYPRACRIPRDGGPEVVLVDGNRLAEGLGYFRLAAVTHSPDHRLVAYGVDDKGSEYYTLRVLDVAGGVLLDDIVAETTGAAIWTPDARAFFYTRLDANHRPVSVHRHLLGTPAAADETIYAEADPGFFVSIGQTHDRRFLIVDAHTHESAEIRILDLEQPQAGLRLVAARTEGHEYSLDHWGDRFVILTNSGGAEDFRIVEAPTDDPGMAAWRDLEPHRPGRLILDVTPYRNHLVRLERENGLPRIVVRRKSDGAEHSIAFPEEAYSLGTSAGYEFDTCTLRFTYSSPTTPSEVWDYDMESRARTLRKRQEVPSGHDPARYVTRRIAAPAADGETVPVTLLYLKETPLDGTAPLLLYGYGSYGFAMPAGFSTSILSLVDRGFVYAIAHVRGGKEKGYRWYTAGKRKQKVNTFTDFIAAARHLIAERFTSEGRIVAEGGSAGGMLMGAIANMAPELFLGIIAQVPFVDVLNTMLDDTLPLTPPEWPEWGNPIESREDFETIRAYSPYDNVAARAYPPILALAGLTDPRVTYWEPAKWVAKLRAMKTDANPLLLKVNMEAGHAGASGRFDRLKEVAITQAFALKLAGLAGQEPDA